MDKEFNPVPTTKKTSRVFVDSINDTEVWLSIQVANGSANVTLTRAQAHLLIDQLMVVVSSLPVEQ